MKTTADNSVQGYKLKYALNQFSENVSAFSAAKHSNVEKMDPLKSFSTELSSGNGSSTNFQDSSLVSAFDNLDLNDRKTHCLLHLDPASDKAKSYEELLLSLDCLPDKEKLNENSVNNINCGSSTEDADEKPRCIMRDHVTNNSCRESGYVELLRTIEVVNVNVSALSSRNANCVKNEDDFSEIGLSEKSLCNVVTSVSEVSCNRLDKEKSNEGSITNVNHSSSDGDAGIKSKCSMTVHVTNNSCKDSECVESLRSTDVVNVNTSASSHVESSRNINHFKNEDDLVACFSEIGLNEKPPGNELTSVSEISSSKSRRDKSSSENLPLGEACGTVSSCANDLPLKAEKDVLYEKEISEPDLGVTDSLSKSSIMLDDFISKKSESLEGELLNFDDHLSDEEILIERGSRTSSEDQKRDQTKLGRTLKVTKDDWPKYLKHMCGGSFIINATPSMPLNRTSNLCDLLSDDFPSDQSSNLEESSSQAPLPSYFDQNGIYPIRQGIPDYHSDNDNSFTASHSVDNFLNDILSSTVTPPPCSDTNFYVPLPAKSTVVLGTQNQQNVHSHQYTGTSYSLLGMCSLSPTSEISGCNGQSNWPATPESGHSCQPTSPASDCDWQSTSPESGWQPTSPESSLQPTSPENTWQPTSPESIYSPSPKSYFPDDGADYITEEDRQKILEIKQDLKNCEKSLKLKDEDMMRIVDDVLSMCPDQLGSQNIHQGFLCDVNASHLQGCSMPTDVNQHQEPSACANVQPQQQSACANVQPQQQSACANDQLQQQSACTNIQLQQQSACANVSLQQQVACVNVPPQQKSVGINVSLSQESATVSPPQVIVVCVPVATEGVNRGQTRFRPILPNPLGQPAHVKTSKKRLLETLDHSKVQHHKYKLYERVANNNNSNVIYIENHGTRQTNLHIAVIKKQVELAYSILEVHKQYNKNMSAVNSRDIYNKTALHYAVRNVMTLFVDYLKELGAK